MSGPSIFDRITSGIAQKGVAAIKKKTPGSIQRHLPLARKLLFGGPDALINSGIDMLMERFGISGTMIPGQSDALLYPTSLLGGISLKQAREMFEEGVETNWQRKNLWFISVTNLTGGEPLNINLFATDVSYTGFSVAGEAVPVGSGSFDLPTNSERIEIRVTTMDDEYGSVKRWFQDRHDRMFYRDGTQGLPVDYLFRVSIIHARVTEQLLAGDDPYVDSFIVRPGNFETDLSRREQAMAEYPMTFVQYDTFTGLS